MRLRIGRILEAVCLLLLLAVVALRPLITETYDSAGLPLTRVLQSIEDPLPFATLTIDAVILLTAVLWLASRALLSDRAYRWCGMEWAGVVIAVAAGASCVFAGNKRLAINGAVDWVSAVLLALLLVQLLRDQWRIRLAVCVIVASAATQAVECIHQAHSVFPETEALYAAQREQIWSQQGVGLDSQRVQLYEARMKAQEASGYLAHSNVAGAHLVMGCLVALSAGLATRRDGWRTVAWAAAFPLWLIALLTAYAAFLTGGLGALTAGAMMLVLMVWYFWKAPARRTALIWGWAAATCFATGVLAYGLARDSLPDRTLTFRWEYWKASVRMVADRPAAGVGSGNFGRHYLHYKSVASPEEVENPHNFLVSAATDWGLAGAVGVLMILIGVSRVGDRRMTREPAPPTDQRQGLAQWVAWCLALAALVFLPRIMLLASDDPAYRFFSTMLPLLAWVAAFMLTAAVPIGRFSTFSTGVAFALLAFLLQDTINFASLIPGTATTAFGLAAIMLASRYVSGVAVARHEIRNLQWWINVAIVCLAALLMAVVIPVAISNLYLRQGRQAGATATALEHYRRAGMWDPFDPQPYLESARVYRSISSGTSRDALGLAVRDLEEAIRRDSLYLPLHRLKCRCHLLRAELTGDSDDRSAAVAAAQRAVHLYPTDPASHELLGDCLAAMGRSERETDALRRAVTHYRKALEIDDARPEWETIRRLRPAQREALRTAITETEDLMEECSRNGG